MVSGALLPNTVFASRAHEIIDAFRSEHADLPSFGLRPLYGALRNSDSSSTESFVHISTEPARSDRGCIDGAAMPRS